MKANPRIPTAVAIAIFSVLAAGPVSAGEGAIKYRQGVMKAIGGHMLAMVTIVSGQGGNKRDLKGHAHALVELAKIAQDVFPEDSSQMEGVTRAKDEIWDNSEEFKKVLQIFKSETAKLAKIAETNDVIAIDAQLTVVGKRACLECHKKFRAKQ